MEPWQNGLEPTDIRYALPRTVPNADFARESVPSVSLLIPSRIHASCRTGTVSNANSALCNALNSPYVLAARSYREQRSIKTYLSADMRRRSLFDADADRYDSWFESGKGKAIFEIEKSCLRSLIQTVTGRWLEVGVGSGRFATSLGIFHGVDPSQEMLSIAARRYIQAVRGIGENLPYRDATFDGVLIVTTLCFLTDVKRTLLECHRVLGPRGTLAVGIVPGESSWGRLHREKGRGGHPFYSRANFYTCKQVIRICAEAEFVFDRAVSCLLTPPSEEPLPSLEEGVNEGAGFVAMRFVFDCRGGRIGHR